jgi:hypothetical protein
MTKWITMKYPSLPFTVAGLLGEEPGPASECRKSKCFDKKLDMCTDILRTRPFIGQNLGAKF